MPMPGIYDGLSLKPGWQFPLRLDGIDIMTYPGIIIPYANEEIFYMITSSALNENVKRKGGKQNDCRKTAHGVEYLEYVRGKN